MDPLYTAVDCPYCDVPAGAPCVSSGGYVYEEGAHADRYASGRRAGRGDDPESRLKLALWFIRQAGGVEFARPLFDAAVNALTVSSGNGRLHRKPDRPKLKLTEEMRQRLMWILIDEGCQCEEEHDAPEDATSITCLSGCALADLEELSKEVAHLRGADE